MIFLGRRLPGLVGPMLNYDLIRSSRKTRHYVFRFLYCLGVLCIFWWVYNQFHWRFAMPGGRQFGAMFGAYFFTTFASVHLAATVVLAATLLGGAIADERQRKTLDFMFVTDLRSHEIVLGKLLARTILTASLLVAPLPILMCVVLFGSVSPEWVAQLAVLTASTLFGFGGFATYLSVVSDRPRDAVSRVVILILAMVTFPPLFLFFVRIYGYDGWWFEPLRWMVDVNPFDFLTKQLRRSIDASWDALWQAVFWQTAMGAVFALLAVRAIRRTVIAPTLRTTRGASLRSGKRRWFARPALGRWPPILWRELFVEQAVRVRGRFGYALMTLIYSSFFGVIIWMFVRNVVFRDRSGFSYYSPEGYVIGMSMLSMIMAISIMLMSGARAATSISSEREADSWTTLIAGPISGESIFWGKFLGAIGGFRMIFWPFAFGWFLALFADAREVWRAPLILALTLLLSAFNVALGVYFSATSKSSRGASVKTILSILMLFGGYLLIVGPFIHGPNAIGVYALCQTFLIGVTSISGVDGPRGPNAEIVGTVFAGCCLYGVATLVMLSVLSSTFDMLAGRCVETFPPTPPNQANAEGGDRTRRDEHRRT